MQYVFCDDFVGIRELEDFKQCRFVDVPAVFGEEGKDLGGIGELECLKLNPGSQSVAVCDIFFYEFIGIWQ